MLDKDLSIEREAEQEYLKAKEIKQYPNGIVNSKCWDNFVSLSKSWKERKDRYYTIKTKSENIQLDLAQSPAKIEIELRKYPLTKSEIDKIKKINTEIWGIVQKAVLNKKKAFGDETVRLTEEGFIPDETSAVTPIVIDLAGRYYTAEEIQQVLVEDLEYKQVGIYTIKKIIKENFNEINALKEKFKSDYSDVRLGYKKSRLQELTELYNQRKSIWNREHKLTDEQELTAILEKIKKEVEGDIVLNGNLNVKVEETANNYIEKELLKNTNIQMIVISRLAGQLNVNPILILSRLAHSRYASFSGLGVKLSDTRDTDPISYASDLTYDWNEIEAKNREFTQQNEKMAELPTPAINVDKAKTLKERLLEKLKKAEQPMKEAKDELSKD